MDLFPGPLAAHGCSNIASRIVAQAPQLAEWMKQHPAERLAAWRCVIGKQDSRGA